MFLAHIFYDIIHEKSYFRWCANEPSTESVLRMEADFNAKKADGTGGTPTHGTVKVGIIL
jgi:hypothetical protein